MNVQEFIHGDVVRIMEDKEKALKLQREFGILWLEEMNDVRLMFTSIAWILQLILYILSRSNS